MGYVSHFRGLGDGTFNVIKRLGFSNNQGVGLAVGDVNNDGQVDVVQTWYPGASTYQIVTNINSNGNLNFFSSNFFFHGLQSALGDLNKDGNIDLAVLKWTAPAIGQVFLYKGNGNGTFSLAVNGVDIGIYQNLYQNTVAISDMNGDGNQDLVFSSLGDTKVSILSGDGNFGFSAPQLLTMPSSVGDLTIVDLDGDLLPDIATANGTNQSTSVVRNLGGGSYSAPVTYTTPGNSAGIVAADFTRDGIVDLVVSNSSGNQVYILPGLGGSTFGSTVSTFVGPNPIKLVAADFNGDGAIDLLVNLFNASTAVVLLNSKNP